MIPDQTRQFVYSLLTVVAVAAVAGRIANAELVFEPSMYRAEGDSSPEAPPRDWPKTRPNPMPTYSSNDRSRWCTVRALVDHGTWVIGHRDPSRSTERNPHGDEGIVFEEGWKTVDKVLNPETRDYYSSKPPLLTLLAAGEYWLLKNALGWSIVNDPNKVVKAIVFTFNAVPLLLYFLMLQGLVERFGASDWGRLFVFTAACFGTFMTTFSTTLNNHTPAAVSVLIAVFPFLKSESGRSAGFGRTALPSVVWLIASGAAAGLAACLELPALALVVALGALITMRSRRAAIAFLAPALAVFALEFVLNKVAIDDWLPTYRKVGGPWYEYPGSHWVRPPGEVKHGIDFARQHESLAAYIFHCIVGHHGVFSLTPIWILSFASMIGYMFGNIRRSSFGTMTSQSEVPRILFRFTLAVSLTVIGFYLFTTDNYGGWTSGLRWLFWLTPLWILTMLPAADRLAGSHWGRGIGFLLLAISVFSASFPAWNPWRHPWLYRLLESPGWFHY